MDGVKVVGPKLRGGM